MDDDAVVNLDLMVALMLLMGGVVMTIYIMPILYHEDRDWRIKQYMTAVRATDSLVQTEGSAANWEVDWNSGNYSSVKKIGFLYIDNSNKTKNKVLNIDKVRALMGKEYKDNNINVSWWEFPSSTTNLTVLENATRLLGLSGYNFYMQLHPVGLKYLDSNPLEINLSNQNINSNIALEIDRYVYIIDPFLDANIKYLKYDNEAIHYRLNLWVW